MHINIFPDRVKGKKSPPPNFWRKAPVLVLLFASTGCTQLDTICQNGFRGTSYSLEFLFLETLIVAVLAAGIVSVIFYLPQHWKLGKWDLRASESAPKFRGVQLFPFIVVLLPLVFAWLLIGAECSDSRKWINIMGVFLGWFIGCVAGFYIFRRFTKSYKKKKSKKDKR